MPNDSNTTNSSDDTPQTIVTDSGADLLDDDGNDIRQDFEFRYNIIEKIASGGMGTILEAEHVVLRKRVALKVLNKALAGDRLSIARFEREARACAALVHPNMVQVYDCGLTPEGTPYLVMDFVPGKDLLNILKEKVRLDATMFFDVFIQVADALQYAHSQGVIHRDLKPGNIILTPGPRETEVPIVVDFGIAKVEEMGGSLQLLTQTGELLGSPSYMSPEQCKGEKVDGRTDIYALGCMMYEALTGKKAFRGQTAMALIQEHLQSRAVPPRDLDHPTELQTTLSDMIMKCMEKEPDKRFQTMSELQEELIAQQKIWLSERQKRKSSMFSLRNLVALSAVVLPLMVFGSLFPAKKVGDSQESSKEAKVTESIKQPSPLVYLSRSLTFQDEDIERWEDNLEALKQAIEILKNTINAFQLRECQNELARLGNPD